MKKGIVLLLALSLFVFSVAGALAVEVGDTVSALENGVRNVDFGDSRYGFCLDYHLGPAMTGAEFTVKSTEANASTNQANSMDVSNQLKLLFVEYFDYYFTNSSGIWNYDGKGNLKMYFKKTGDFQNAIWKITNPDDFVMVVSPEVQNMVEHVKEMDAQQYIPDQGYTKTYTSGSSITVTFDFWSLSPEQKYVAEDGSEKDMQSFFMYKVTPVSASATDSPLVTPSPKPEESETPKPEESETPKPEETETPKPEETETPTPVPENTPAPGDPGSGANGGSPDGLPKTGDDTKLTLWLSLFAVTGVSLLVALRRRHMC